MRTDPLPSRASVAAVDIPGLQSRLRGELLRPRDAPYDAVRRVARAQPGLTWGEFAEQAQTYGLAISSGDAGAVGVGGLTLGGGIGWMVRKHGLTIDSLLAVEIVAADGRLVRASDEENADLFWALRGGGGNFGIATAFEFRLHEVGTVLGGAVVHSGAEAAGVLRAYGACAATAPEEITTIAMVIHAPPAPFIPAELQGEPVVMVMVCSVGEATAGERALTPFRSLGTPIAEFIQPMPYPALFGLTEMAVVSGLHHSTRSMYLEALHDDVVDTVFAFTRRTTSPLGLVQVRQFGGAMARVDKHATAFAHRDKPFLLVIDNAWPDGQDASRHRARTAELWRSIRDHSAGAYVGFLGNEGIERIREAYPPTTYERLVAVKDRYDPMNLFSHNQNITPPPDTSRRQRPRYD